MCLGTQLGERPWTSVWYFKSGQKIPPVEHYCCLVAKLCLTLCNPMDYSTPGFPVLHYLPEFAQTHVHWVSDAIQPSYPLLSPSPPDFYLSQHQGLFQWVGSSHQVAKVLELQHWVKYGALHVCVLSSFSHVWLCATLWTVACQAPLSMGFSRQESWSGLPFPSSGDLPDPGIEATCLRSTCIGRQVLLPLHHLGSPCRH